MEQGSARYTAGMDTVRFGRALGCGVRSVARSLIQAVDAAKAEPGPLRSAASSTVRAPQVRTPPAKRVVSEPARASSPGFGLRGPLEGARRFRDSALRPFVRLSGVLLLEISGVFFAIFALYGMNAMWRARSAWQTGPNHGQFLGGAILLAVFGYFCISSFMRAWRRERGR